MKVTIVGGGIGGMVSALLLQKEGFEVTIIEQKDKLGGRLTFVEEGDYKIDEGPTIVLLPDILKDILSRCGISENELPLHRCDPMYDMIFSDGTRYRKYASIEQQRQHIEDLFPGESKGLDSFLSSMRNTFNIGKPLFLDRDFIDKRDFLTPKNLYTLWKLKAYENTRKMAKKYFNHSHLQEAYSFQTLYIGGNPFTTPAIYNLIAFSEHEHGVWYLKGGYASLVDVLKRKLIEANVQIFYNESVKNFLIRDNIVYGVTTPNNTYTSDIVISNIDYPTTEQLLPTSYQKKSWEASSGCYLLYMGLDKTYKDVPLHQFVMSKDTKQHMDEVFVTKMIPTNPSIYSFNPSLIDDSLAPAGHSVLYVLVPVPSGEQIDWSNQESFKESILYALEQNGFNDLRQHIRWIKVRTPQEAQMDGLFQGSSFGLAPNLLQSAAFRPQVQPTSLENFYAVGASVHPGGGIPIVLTGVNTLVDLINNKHNLVRSENFGAINASL